VIAIGGESASVAVVDAASGKVAARPGPVPIYKTAATPSPDGTTIYFVAADQAGAKLFALDARTHELVLWLSLDSPVSPQQLDGVWIRGRALSLTPDGTRLLVGGAFLSDPTKAVGTEGEVIAVLDVQTRRLVGTVDPLQVRGSVSMAMLPRGAALSAGGVVAIGSRTVHRSARPTLDQLFVIDAATLAVIDSALIAPSRQDSDVLLGQVLASPDGGRAYVTDVAGSIYVYDLVTRRVTRSVRFPNRVSITIAPDGQRIYATNGGNLFDSPGAGVIYVMDADLQPLPTIDLRDHALLDRVTPALGAPVVGSAHPKLYVAAGTSSIGPLFGSQPLRILEVDLHTRELNRAIPLNDFGRAWLFLTHR
jgi:DNA-binding beta-propeller fold protein YncE